MVMYELACKELLNGGGHVDAGTTTSPLAVRLPLNPRRVILLARYAHF